MHPTLRLRVRGLAAFITQHALDDYHSEDRAISLALCAQAPIAYSPTSAGPEVSVSWKSEHGGGIYRDGNHGDSCFTVLFDLRQCLKKKSKGWFRDGNSADPEGVEK